MRILVLEGDPEVRSSLVGLLIWAVGGSRVRAEGKELSASLADILREFQPELVLMSWRDFRQPILDQIKRFAPTVPVWVFSGYRREEVASEANGADAIFEKGDSQATNKLLQAIRSLRDGCLRA